MSDIIFESTDEESDVVNIHHKPGDVIPTRYSTTMVSIICKYKEICKNIHDNIINMDK